MDAAPIVRVLAKLPSATRTGSGWKARCPAHKDDRPSLSIGVGQEGQVLLCCHAGCTLEAILAALGLAAADLFPPSSRINPPGRSTGGPSRSTRQRRIFAVYDYVDAANKLQYQTVRLEPKDFYQRRPNGQGGWINNLDGVERVLYRLPELLSTPLNRAVWIPEGEKDADALVALGLIATTAVGGASAPWLPHYTDAVRDRKVVLLQDNDAPGQERAWTIARAVIGEAARVRILAFPNVPPKGDVSDWLAAGHTKAELIALAKATPVLTEEDFEHEDGGNASYHHIFDTDADKESGDPTAASLLIPVPPLPVEVFPRPLQRFVLEGADALGVPVDMVAIPLLGFAAGVLGHTRVLRVKKGWITRPILWLAVVGAPGSGKSPALDHARHPLDVLQRSAWDRYQDAVLDWEQKVLAAKQAKLLPPDKPHLEHFLTTDATMEALAVMLGTSPGVVVVRDELVGWVKSHDAYRKAGDREQWLSLWAGAPMKVDRRTAGPIYVPKPTAVVVGGIQPDLLPQLAAEAKQRDGFVDRVLAGWPNADPQPWTEATVRDATLQGAEDLFRLLRPAVRGDAPYLHDFTPEAKGVFADWYNANVALTAKARGLAQGCYAKYPAQCARLALVLHCLRHPKDFTASVAESTVHDAIAVVEYFRGHLARVLPAFGASAPTSSARLVDRVARILREANGAWVARTDLFAALGRAVTAEALTAALQDLARQGRVESRMVATGARPREEWRWITPSEAGDEADEDPETDTERQRRNEDMKNWESNPGNSSYLHFFGDDTDRDEAGRVWQETFL